MADETKPAEICSMFEVRGQGWTLEVGLRNGAWYFDMKDSDGTVFGGVENVDPASFQAALQRIMPDIIPKR